MDQVEPEWIDFRGLVEAIDDYQRASLCTDVLAPWLQENGPAARRWLQSLAERPGDPVPATSDGELWDLYALSRANDTLLLGFQPPGRVGRTWTLSGNDYAGFVGAIGLQMVSEPHFSPFFHEIVAVEQDADHAAAPTVTGEHWPAVMLGELMIARAGVTLRSGRDFVRKEIAESSRMYWAYRRNNRPTHDLSVGWGSNSQWRTCFRRDYRIGGRFRFNVDGNKDLSVAPAGPDEEGLTAQERRELLQHRCFVTRPDPVDRCFPFDDTYSMPIPASA